jgi:SAM-dependent methyltransferase
MDSQRWSAALWPFVRSRLPASPATVLELGCGPAGGFVPALREHGYEAVGIDPNAPETRGFHRIGFEQYEPPQPVDAIVASRSLHHVGDLGEVVGSVVAALRPGGTLIVAEWAWEQFDADTAEWCFARMGADDESPDGWLRRRRDAWAESGEDWESYFFAWAAGHGLHRGEDILDGLAQRFDTAFSTRGPYFFADLAGVREADEEEAIAAGAIRATGIRYAGTPRPRA